MAMLAHAAGSNDKKLVLDKCRLSINLNETEGPGVSRTLGDLVGGVQLAQHLQEILTRKSE